MSPVEYSISHKKTVASFGGFFKRYCLLKMPFHDVCIPVHEIFLSRHP
jgi:hypothetical protein